MYLITWPAVYPPDPLYFTYPALYLPDLMYIHWPVVYPPDLQCIHLNNCISTWPVYFHLTCCTVHLPDLMYVYPPNLLDIPLTCWYPPDLLYVYPPDLLYTYQTCYISTWHAVYPPDLLYIHLTCCISIWPADILHTFVYPPDLLYIYPPVFSAAPPVSRVNIRSIRIHLGSIRGQPRFPHPGNQPEHGRGDWWEWSWKENFGNWILQAPPSLHFCLWMAYSLNCQMSFVVNSEFTVCDW
jgi:hypothetical protein